MKRETSIAQIPGGAELVRWFGAAPSFHDAEVLALLLKTDDASSLVVRHSRVTRQKDERGFYMQDRAFIATFAMHQIDRLELRGFSGQNVLNSLSVAIRPDAAGFDIELEDTYGIGGRMGCMTLSVSFEAE